MWRHGAGSLAAWCVRSSPGGLHSLTLVDQQPVPPGDLLKHYTLAGRLPARLPALHIFDFMITSRIPLYVEINTDTEKFEGVKFLFL